MVFFYKRGIFMYSGQEVIITALIAIVLAQVLKVFFYYRKFHVINYKLLGGLWV